MRRDWRRATKEGHPPSALMSALYFQYEPSWAELLSESESSTLRVVTRWCNFEQCGCERWHFPNVHRVFGSSYYHPRLLLLFFLFGDLWKDILLTRKVNKQMWARSWKKSAWLTPGCNWQVLTSPHLKLTLQICHSSNSGWKPLMKNVG